MLLRSGAATKMAGLITLDELRLPCAWRMAGIGCGFSTAVSHSRHVEVCGGILALQLGHVAICVCVCGCVGGCVWVCVGVCGWVWVCVGVRVGMCVCMRVYVSSPL